MKPKQTLRRQQRLRHSRDFQRIIKSGKRLQNSWFRLFFIPREGSSRMAVSVKKADYRSAVVRNRIRRKVREFFRTRQEAFQPAHDLLVMPKKNDAMFEPGACQRELLALLKKAGLFLE